MFRELIVNGQLLRRRKNLRLTCSLRCQSSVKSSLPGSLPIEMYIFQEQDYNDLYLTKCRPFYMWLAGEIVVNRCAVVNNREQSQWCRGKLTRL